jgi:OOP family OmpA-OmpF porin
VATEHGPRQKRATVRADGASDVLSFGTERIESVPGATMTSPTSTSDPVASPRGRRRRILLGGGVALALVAAGGALEGIPRAERDLERRVDRRLADRGITGVHSSFSGQDGTLHCDAPIADPAAARSIAEDVWGVRVAHVADECIAAAAATTTAPATTAPATTAPATTVAPTTVAPTTVAPTTTAATTTTTAASAASAVSVELDAGRLVLTGSVADAAARTQLVDTAGTVVDPTNVDDQLQVDADATADAASLDALTGLVAAMPANLVSGTASLGTDGALAISGVYVDDAARDAVAAAAATAGADTDLTARPDATASDAAALADELNAFVTANPILFAPGRATLTPEASAVVDQVAAIANRFDGVQIGVVGHTDTDGDAGRNLTLSEQRAAAVRDALAARGVTAPLTSSGRGETEPVLVNGVEDKTASRRVVFDVTAS